MEYGRRLLDRWGLDPAITYLNHGTVGATPRAILAAQQAIRDEIERQPARFLLREVYPLAGGVSPKPTRLRTTAADVGAFLGAEGDDLVFIDNATAGVNIVLRSLTFRPGDQILVTNHSYPTSARLAAFVAARDGASVRTVDVPYPTFDAAELVARVASAITPNTKIAMLDHITSESALLFPLAELVAVCRAAGVPVLVDAAHAPGQIPVHITALGVDYYTANLHKWAHAPRSCGVLWVRRDHQVPIQPPILSWGYGSGFTAEFDWAGTRDVTPWLAAPAGIAYLHELDWEAARRYQHDLAWRAARALTASWKTPLERDETSVASMVTLPLPHSLGSTMDDARWLRDRLLEEDRIEAQTSLNAGRLWVRICVQVYNDWSDIERLDAAIARLT